MLKSPLSKKKLWNHFIDSGCFQVEIVGHYSLRSCVICSEVRNILSQEFGLKHWKLLWKRGNLHYIWQDTLIYERNIGVITMSSSHVAHRKEPTRTDSLVLFYFTLRCAYFEGSEKTQTNCQYFCIISFFFCFVFLPSFYFLSFLFDLLWRSRASREWDPYRRYSYASPDRFWQKIPTCHDMCSHFRSLLKICVDYYIRNIKFI